MMNYHNYFSSSHFYLESFFSKIKTKHCYWCLAGKRKRREEELGRRDREREDRRRTGRKRMRREEELGGRERERGGWVRGGRGESYITCGWRRKKKKEEIG